MSRQTVEFLSSPAKRWLSLALLVALAWGVRLAMDVSGNGTAMSDDQLAAVAATVQVGDVTMYTTTDCVYCHRAKAWLDHHGFAYSECNMSLEAHCAREFQALGAAGTPFLLVRRGDTLHQMKRGFDREQFLSLLAP